MREREQRAPVFETVLFWVKEMPCGQETGITDTQVQIMNYIMVFIHQSRSGNYVVIKK
jgi:hypothetical protein